MAAHVVTLVPASDAAAASVDQEMNDFLGQVTHIRSMADLAAMSGAEHIARLHRPGAKYFNMNPFEVLGLTHKAIAEEVRAAYRRLSVKVHPDKNPGNERAQTAFEVVKAAAARPPRRSVRGPMRRRPRAARSGGRSTLRPVPRSRACWGRFARTRSSARSSPG
jgi:hypothetical protein